MSLLETIRKFFNIQTGTDLAKECIISVVKKLEEKVKNIDTDMIIPSGVSRIYTLDRWNWTLHVIDYLELKNKLMQSVYYLARKIERIPDMCTGEIDFFINDERKEYSIYSTSYIITANDNKFSLEDPKYLDFLKEFHSRIQGKKICSLSIGFFKYKDAKLQKGHATMLFIENKQSENTLNLYFYDPHGAGDVFYKRESFIFLSWLRTSYQRQYRGTTVNIIERETFSCPRGIQGIIPETKMGKQGYCIMYSYFWLYIILHCSNSIPNVDLNTLISNIEKTVISLIGNPELLAQIIYVFTENIVSVAHDNMPNLKDYFEELHTFMLENMKNKPSQPVTPLEERPPMPEKEHDTYTRRKDNETCTNNKDCMSDCCSKKSGKCKAPKYYGKRDTDCKDENEPNRYKPY